MSSRTFNVRILQENSKCAIPVPFDPKVVFGKVRAPVKVTLNGYTYKSTIASMGGQVFIPLKKSHREAAGVEGGQQVKVTIDHDTEKREVEVPRDLAKALKARPPAWEGWAELSFTHQREYVEAIEEAKKPETRARRIEKTVEAIAARAAKKPTR